MADTERSRAELEAILADNVTRDISPQDLRDFLASTLLRSESTPSADATSDWGAPSLRWRDIHASRAVYGPLFDSGGAVFNVMHPDFGAKWDGSTDDNAAVSAALAAAGTVAPTLTTGGGAVVLLPPGTGVLSGGLTVPPGVTVTGAGSRATVIKHTGNNICFNAHGGHASTLVPVRRFMGFALIGNSGAAARGIDFGDFFGAHLEDLMVQDYTAFIGIRIGNDSLWTEGSTWINVHVRNCAYCIVFGRTSGTESFAETRMLGVSLVASAANQICLHLDGGCTVYGSFLNIKGNLEGDATSKFIHLGGSLASIIDSTFQIYVEGASGVFVHDDSGGDGRIWGTGQFVSGSAMTESLYNGTQIQVLGSHVVRSPGALVSGNTNNYQAGVANVLRLSANASGSTLTGIVGRFPVGDIIIINVSANTLTLSHEDTNSTASNRFVSPTGANVALGQNDSVRVLWDALSDRWRIISIAV